MSNVTPSGTSRPFAVVTGGSSGIGLQLAKQFAINGYDVLIAAEAGVDEAVAELRKFTVDIQGLTVDLSKFEGVHELYGKITESGRPLDAIAINAGFGLGGSFVDETDLDRELTMIDLNVKSSVHLAKHVLRDMKARNAGKVLFTSSVAAVMPSPFEAVYGATKGFLLLFSEALANELKDTNVTVTALLPGPTDTNFFHRAEMDDTKAGQDPKDDAAGVAKRGFDALMAGKEKAYVGSFKNRVMGMMADLLPDDVGAAAHRKLAEPGSGGASIR